MPVTLARPSLQPQRALDLVQVLATVVSPAEADRRADRDDLVDQLGRGRIDRGVGSPGCCHG